MGHGHANLPPLKFLKYMADKPRSALAMTCGAHCFVLLLFVILFATLGSDFFPFSSSVPLYLVDHYTREREDALRIGKDIASYSPVAPLIQLERSIDIDQDNIPIRLEILYISKFGDILETQQLERIHALEKRVRASAGYEKYCAREWTTANYATAAAAQTNNNYTEVIALNNGPSLCKRPLTVLTSCIPSISNGSPGSPNCNDTVSTPPGILDCNSFDGCDDASLTVDDDFKQFKVRQFAAPGDFFLPSHQQFIALTGNQFAAEGSTAVSAIRSEFRFALPLPGYDTVDDRRDAQLDEIKEWVFDTYQELLFDKDFDGMDVWFDGYGMVEGYINAELMLSAVFAVFSFVFVLCYIAVMTQSWFLAIMGMGQIFLSFFSAYILYFYVCDQKYFGTFNLLSIFIILGIGADDIFVFLDTFNQAGAALGKDANLHARMSWAWRRAARAMAVTSATTIASFLTNATSSFPAIVTFGVFAAMLVLVNYCSVCLYYPTVVAVYDTHYRGKPFCCSLGPKVKAKLASCRGKKESDDENDEDAEKPKGQTADMGAIERWFEHTYVPFVLKWKWGVIAVSGAFIIAFISQAAQLKTDPNPPAFFPDGNNYAEFSPAKAGNFARGGSIYSVQMEFNWGFDKNTPIDRSDANPSDEEDPGVPNFRREFSLHSSARCMVEMCDKVSIKNDRIKVAGEPDYEVDCPMRVMRDYVLLNYNQSVWDDATGPRTDPALDEAARLKFGGLLLEWINSNSAIYAKWKPFIFAERTGETTGEIRFVRGAEFKLTASLQGDYKLGEDLAGEWENWWVEQMRESGSECEASGDIVRSYPNGAFSYFFVQGVLSSEAYAGIGISLGVGFAILSLATNNIITSFISVCVIGCIVAAVMGFTVMNGWGLGITESINFVMVPGMAVDFVAHLAEGYTESAKPTREGKVTDMLVHVGVSVVSGAMSTLGAAFFLFFPTITFFQKFGTFIFMTILFSLYFALFFFSAVMAVCGPEGNTGSLSPMWRALTCGRFGNDDEEPHKIEDDDEPQSMATPLSGPDQRASEHVPEIELQEAPVEQDNDGGRFAFQTPVNPARRVSQGAQGQADEAKDDDDADDDLVRVHASPAEPSAASPRIQL